ncbi:30S ribosomal protein S16 [Candidatus Microgenomates bacterium]|nr:30S ribosomal protein S16 [Candidatus Microgenomates bacterium]
MLKIRLSRIGKKNQPHYRIVVTEARSRRNGAPVATIGSWHPGEDKIVLSKAEYETWLHKGAQPTAAVRQLATK